MHLSATKVAHGRVPRQGRAWVWGLTLTLLSAGATAQSVVYKCPASSGGGVLYTDNITSREAKERGCKTLDGAPVTVVQSVRPRPSSSATASNSEAKSGEGRGMKVDAAEQKARDSDRRLILESELSKEEAALAALKKEFNNGEPERRGEERNYQRYLDRVEEMKAAIARKESDIAALRREIGKLP